MNKTHTRKQQQKTQNQLVSVANKFFSPLEFVLSLGGEGWPDYAEQFLCWSDV